MAGRGSVRPVVPILCLLRRTTRFFGSRRSPRTSSFRSSFSHASSLSPPPAVYQPRCSQIVATSSVSDRSAHSVTVSQTCAICCSLNRRPHCTTVPASLSDIAPPPCIQNPTLMLHGRARVVYPQEGG